jgi:outer membrane protein
MRVTSFFGACALMLGVATVSQGQAVPKVAFVNSQAILANAPGRAEAEAQFEKEMATVKDKLAKLQDSLTAMNEAFQKEEPSLQGAAKEARLKTLREKEQGFQSQAQKLQDGAQSRQEELMAPIMDGVRKALDDVRAEGGYAFIFDVAAGAFIVSADKNLDITDRVVAKLRLSAPKLIGPQTKPATGPASAPAGLSTKKPPTT